MVGEEGDVGVAVVCWVGLVLDYLGYCWILGF